MTHCFWRSLLFHQQVRTKKVTPSLKIVLNSKLSFISFGTSTNQDVVNNGISHFSKG